MQYDKTNLSWIGVAAALAGGTAYYFSKNGMRLRRTIDNDIAIDRTTEVLRASPQNLVVGAGITVALASVALWGLRSRKGTTRNGIQSTEETLELMVPVSTAYNQWTQFEEFPRFMPTVHEVKQIDDSHLHWKATVAGKEKEWDSEIVQQIPDQLIEWRSTSGVRNGGTVTFDKVRDNCTRVKLRLWYQPESGDERLGGLLGGVKLTAKGNLKRFKQLLETRGGETGAWRGEIAPQH